MADQRPATTEPSRSVCADPRCGHRLDDHGAGVYRDGCWERGCPCDQYRYGFTGQRGSEAGCYG